MADDRTEPQIAADHRLDEAIRGYVNAYDLVTEGEMVTDWCIPLATLDLDGEHGFIIASPGPQASHVTVGLLHYANAVVLAPDTC